MFVLECTSLQGVFVFSNDLHLIIRYSKSNVLENACLFMGLGLVMFWSLSTLHEIH